MSPKSAIFPPKTEAPISRLPRREKRRKGKSPKSFGGRGFKWREPRQSLGRKPFKPQTALLRWSRAVGPSRCPATGGNAHTSLQLVTEWAFAKAGRRETSRLIWNAAFRPDGSEQQKG
jgi:hypothetical protein